MKNPNLHLNIKVFFFMGHGNSMRKWTLQKNLFSYLVFSLILVNVTQIYNVCWGPWVAQSGEHLTLGLGSGLDLRVVGSSPALGSTLGMETTLKIN